MKTIEVTSNGYDCYRIPTRMCLVCECKEDPSSDVVNTTAAWLCDKCRAALLKVVEETEKAVSEMWNKADRRQIEEMASILTEYCNIKKKDCSLIADCDICRAEALYNADYRKQSEGEWVAADICAEDMYCSVCGGIAPVDCEKEEFYKSTFCPNCGARMK